MNTMPPNLGTKATQPNKFCARKTLNPPPPPSKQAENASSRTRFFAMHSYSYIVQYIVYGRSQLPATQLPKHRNCIFAIPGQLLGDVFFVATQDCIKMRARKSGGGGVGVRGVLQLSPHSPHVGTGQPATKRLCTCFSCTHTHTVLGT